MNIKISELIQRMVSVFQRIHRIKTRDFHGQIKILLIIAIIISCISVQAKEKENKQEIYDLDGKLIKTTISDKYGKVMSELYHQWGECRTFSYQKLNRVDWTRTDVNIYKVIFPDSKPQYIKVYEIIKPNALLDRVTQDNKVLSIVGIEKLPEIDTANLSEHRAKIIEVLSEEKIKAKQQYISDIQAFQNKNRDNKLKVAEGLFNNCLKVLNHEILRLEKEIENFKVGLMQVKFQVNKEDKYYKIGLTGEPIIVLKMADNRELRYDPWTSKAISEKTFKGRLAQETYLFDEEGNKYLFAKYNYTQRGNLFDLFNVDVFDRNGSLIKQIFQNRFGPTYIYIHGGDNKWMLWTEPINESLEKLDILLGHLDDDCGYSTQIYNIYIGE